MKYTSSAPTFFADSFFCFSGKFSAPFIKVYVSKKLWLEVEYMYRKRHILAADSLDAITEI
jgi:hypothetical protein